MLKERLSFKSKNAKKPRESSYKRYRLKNLNKKSKMLKDRKSLNRSVFKLKRLNRKELNL